MTNPEGFRPDWISAPGDTILDILEDREISQESFGKSMGISNLETNYLLSGRSTVTMAIARRLTRILGASVEFWITRDFQFRQDAKPIEDEEENWLRQLPVGDMIKFGWLEPPPHPSEEFEACKAFFAVSSVREWHQYYGSPREMASYRSSPSFESHQGALAAWLRQGEILATKINCQKWHADRFQKSLARIRVLTRQKDPSRFVPQLQEACSENGVATVIVRSPSGCRASGATRFLSRNKAILQLSFRYLTDDQFWFTFFHEAGHLLLHGERRFFSATLGDEKPWILEGFEMPVAAGEEEEEEANQFAADNLIPSEFQRNLLSLPPESKTVLRFARRVGVSSGIIVGQLQHHGRIGYDQMNRLKRRFVWQD